MAEKKKYPIGPEHYILYEEIGHGVSAIVHRALCVSFYEIVAIKILDFERDNCDLNNISREAQTMLLVDHPNILKSHCSFVNEHNLWVVMPFMAGGSCLHIMKIAHPDGFEENIIATILKEVLKGLEYLHHHGHIHRDIKAGNLLIDAHAGLKLGDFGVSACLYDSGDRQRTRNSFVGTPCWMAPEVMEQLHGYDFKADIWSFGITALELAHGHAPFSKYPPMKVLLMTLQHAPPCLDSKKDKKFSKSFKQMIGCCLVKDPSKRPSAKKLLKHSFFKQARSNDYISRTLLEGLPALGDRMASLKKKEDMRSQQKMPNGDMDELSLNAYKRGISGWNFNLEDMKAEASLIQDFDDAMSDINRIGSSCSLSTLDSQLPSPTKNSSQTFVDMEDNDEKKNQSIFIPIINSVVTDPKFEEYEHEHSNIACSSHECHSSQTSSPHLDNHVKDKLSEKPNIEDVGRSIPSHHRRRSSSSILFEVTLPPIREESEKPKNQPNISNYNSPLVPQTGEDVLTELPSKVMMKSSVVNFDDNDEKVKVPVVQQRGRFKVVASPILQKSHSLQVIAQHNIAPLPSPLPLSSSDATSSSNFFGSSLFTVLHSVLQTNILQRESILSLMKQITTNDYTVDGTCIPAQIKTTEKSLLEAAHDKEKELLNELTELQRRHICSEEELQKLKTENARV
ncbi:hypothetical protein VNO77_29484 [Canavalia gladiata]|uniref:Protein kinase domain-containing protein n=1 Tax=Canavalia gladiata TaxID=3824 RepID=A0AAN9Q7X2_CANGL